MEKIDKKYLVTLFNDIHNRYGSLDEEHLNYIKNFVEYSNLNNLTYDGYEYISFLEDIDNSSKEDKKVYKVKKTKSDLDVEFDKIIENDEQLRFSLIKEKIFSFKENSKTLQSLNDKVLKLKNVLIKKNESDKFIKYCDSIIKSIVNLIKVKEANDNIKIEKIVQEKVVKKYNYHFGAINLPSIDISDTNDLKIKIDHVDDKSLLKDEYDAIIVNEKDYHEFKELNSIVIKKGNSYGLFNLTIADSFDLVRLVTEINKDSEIKKITINQSKARLDSWYSKSIGRNLFVRKRAPYGILYGLGESFDKPVWSLDYEIKANKFNGVTLISYMDKTVIEEPPKIPEQDLMKQIKIQRGSLKNIAKYIKDIPISKNDDSKEVIKKFNTYITNRINEIKYI